MRGQAGAGGGVPAAALEYSGYLRGDLAGALLARNRGAASIGPGSAIPPMIYGTRSTGHALRDTL